MPSPASDSMEIDFAIMAGISILYLQYTTQPNYNQSKWNQYEEFGSLSSTIARIHVVSVSDGSNIKFSIFNF